MSHLPSGYGTVFKTDSYVCIPPNILKLMQATKNCHTDIYFKTKTAVAHAAKCWTQCHIFQNVENEMLNIVQYFSKHSVQSYAVLLVAVANASEPQVRRSCWVFTELTWNLSIRSEAAWAKSFIVLLAYRQQIIQNQCKAVRIIITTNVCWRKSSCELFPLATTHAKVSHSSKMVIARYRIRYFFQKRAALPLTLLEN